MSTKIYCAWKLKISKLDDFIDIIRPQIFDIAATHITRIAENTNDEKMKSFYDKYKEGYYPSYCTGENRKIEFALDLSEEASKSMNRSPGIDIDFALNIWILRKYAYIIPVGEVRRNILLIPMYAKDYSYWNNTDEPEGISNRKWNKRRKIWDRINCGEGVHSHNARRLCHSIISMSQRDFTARTEISKLVKQKMETQ